MFYLDNFLRKKAFLFLICSRHTAYLVRDNAKTFTSVGLSCKDIIFFQKTSRVRCSLRKIK